MHTMGCSPLVCVALRTCSLSGMGLSMTHDQWALRVWSGRPSREPAKSEISMGAAARPRRTVVPPITSPSAPFSSFVPSGSSGKT